MKCGAHLVSILLNELLGPHCTLVQVWIAYSTETSIRNLKLQPRTNSTYLIVVPCKSVRLCWVREKNPCFAQFDCYLKDPANGCTLLWKSIASLQCAHSRTIHFRFLVSKCQNRWFDQVLLPHLRNPRSSSLDRVVAVIGVSSILQRGSLWTIPFEMCDNKMIKQQTRTNPTILTFTTIKNRAKWMNSKNKRNGKNINARIMIWVISLLVNYSNLPNFPFSKEIITFSTWEDFGVEGLKWVVFGWLKETTQKASWPLSCAKIQMLLLMETFIGKVLNKVTIFKNLQQSDFSVR